MVGFNSWYEPCSVYSFNVLGDNKAEGVILYSRWYIFHVKQELKRDVDGRRRLLTGVQFTAGIPGIAVICSYSGVHRPYYTP